ncbi:unnamed protein product, partial [Adineta ricciae]
HTSIAMFISEIPVRYQKSIQWIRDLSHRTTVQDVISSVLPLSEPNQYSLYIYMGRHRQLLKSSSRIYKIVASFNQQQCARRLLFEIRPVKVQQSKKRVRFADEIIVQDIKNRCVSTEKSEHNMIETVSIPIEKRLEKLKENFQKTIQQKQENYVKLCTITKRSTLRVINENVPKHVCVQTATIKQIVRSSSESGISSSSSNDDLVVPTQRLETLSIGTLTRSSIMELNTTKNPMHLPACENIVKRYGKYTRKVNGELVKIVYDWFEPEDSNQYKLCLTRKQYDLLKIVVSPIDSNGEPLAFDRYCDVLIPVITAGEDDHHDDYSIWLAFRSFKKSRDRYIEASELENLIHIIGQSVDREQIRVLIDKIDWDHNGLLDYNEFRQFIIRGYARELLMMDITRETVYSVDRVETPTMTHRF